MSTSDPAPEHAMHQSTEQTRTYPCAACGGQLEFDIATQKLRCPNCGGTQEIVEDAGRVTAEQDFRATVAALKANASAAPPQLEGQKEVVCQNCGGHTTFTGTLTSTRCPYCATPIQRDDVYDAPARLPVDGVVPFHVDEATARAAVEKWIRGRWFAPSEFKTYKQTGSFASVYTSYFTYDADARTHYQGRRGENYTVTVGTGEQKRQETRVRWTDVTGNVRDTFDDLCVLANTGFDQARISALEPWPTDKAQPFSAEYVAGHMCRTYDRDVEACFDDAKQRIEPVVEQSIRKDIGGDQQEVARKDVRFATITFKYLLLPVWLLTVIYAGKPFQVFINGVTGEVQGERPWSKVKLLVAAAVVIVVIVALVVLLG